MNIAMTPVEILALKPDMQTVTHTLRGLGCVHIDDVSNSPEVLARQLSVDRDMINQQEAVTFLLARIDGLSKTLNIHFDQPIIPQESLKISEIRSGLEQLVPKVQSLLSQREDLQARLTLLPRYEATLRKLLPIIPPSARQPGNVSIGVLVGRTHVGILDSISRRILDLTSARAELVASDVDTSTRGMFIVFPAEFHPEIEALLGREDVTRLRLPGELSEGPPDVILQTLHRQLTTIPLEIDRLNQELNQQAHAWGDRLSAWRAALNEELEANSVFSRFGETEMTFVITGWIPADQLPRTEAALREAVGDKFLLHQLPMNPQLKNRAPILLHNPKPATPFESLVGLLALPRYGHIDPTCLIAFFMPIFFGMILGDVGYGLVLLTLSLSLLKKFKNGVIRDVIIILAMGSAWAIVFGFLFGEFFGTLGERFGMQALWFERASPDHVAGLLVMTIAIGVIHVTLGLVLGVWEGIKDRNKSHLLERGGMLIGLIALFLIVAVLAKQLPASLMTPSIAMLIVGIVLLGASLGWLGILMGPIEFISLIGNILSYLRIAAIGLASVYLAEVANEMAGVAGNLVVGAILAILIHALNLTLGAFSPTIHSLRLHYVEFFRKFYEGGGRPYQPYRRGSS